MQGYRVVRMCLNLRDPQLKIITFIYGMLLYMNLMVTTKQKCLIHTHTHTHTQRKEFKYNTKDSNQITNEKSKRRIKEQKIITKTMNKKATSICLSIITLNVNGLNAPIKRHRVAEWIQN